MSLDSAFFSLGPTTPIKKSNVTRKRTTSTSEKDGNIHIKGNRTVYTAGRPPWYNSSGQINEPLVVGICGGSASGKTTVAKKIIEEMNVQWVSLLSMDSFYKVKFQKKLQLF